MRQLSLLVFFSLFVFSCGSEEATDENPENENVTQEEDNSSLEGAIALQEKFAAIYASYFDLAQLPIEETVCSGSGSMRVPEVGHVLNVYVSTNFLLANFDAENPGAYGYKMPNAAIANGTPVRDFSWLNFSGTDSTYFEVYGKYPNLADASEQDQGSLEEMSDVNTKLSSGLFGVIAIVDYMAPRQIEISRVEGGYIMGYVMFADWETASVSCMTPFLAANGDVSDFNGSVDMTLEDLEKKTYMQLDSIARVATSYDGEIVVNP